MLPDPPHKKGYYTKKPINKSFVTWNDMNKYQQKMNKLNVYLEKQQDFTQKSFYKQELDRLVELKNRDKRSNSICGNLKKIQQNAKLIQDYEVNQKSFLFQVQKKNLNSSKQNQINKNRESQNFRRQQNENEKNQINENKKMQEMQQTQKKRQRFLNGQFLKSQYDNYYENQQVQRKKNQEQDQKYSKQEKQNIDNLMNSNKKFYERIRGRMIKPEMEEFYQKVLKDEQAKQNEIDFYFIDATMLKKLKKELQEEKFEIQNRMKMKDSNLSFLKKQIENNELKKELLDFEEQRMEYLQLKNELTNQKMKDEEFKQNYQKKIRENLEYLKKQIEEKKKLLFNEEYLTQYEAKHNNLTTQLVDYENPSKDLVCGLPGFVRPYDRVRQLELLKKSTLQNNSMTLNQENKNTNKKRFSRYRTEKKQNKGLTFQPPKNDFGVVKQKMTQRPFNIISNTIMYNQQIILSNNIQIKLIFFSIIFSIIISIISSISFLSIIIISITLISLRISIIKISLLISISIVIFLIISST